MGRELDRVGRIAPDAVHARVDLEVHGEGFVRTVRENGFGEGVDAGSGVDDRREPIGDDHFGRGRDGLRQHEDRCLDPGFAQLDPLFHERDGEVVGAGLERGPAHRHRAVPVSVGLHHRGERGRRDEGVQRVDVAADGVEIYLGPYGPKPIHVRWSAR